MRPGPVDLPDGVYQVTAPINICAGFVVQGGRVIDRAPILTDRWRDVWLTLALRLDPFDHNGECLYCDEPGAHAPGCRWELTYG